MEVTKLSARERIQREACPQGCGVGLTICEDTKVLPTYDDPSIVRGPHHHPRNNGDQPIPCTAPTPDAIIERLDAELSTQRALTSQYREMAEERLNQVKRLEEVVGKVREALQKHHQWHMDIGTVLTPVEGSQPIELDLTDAYCESSLYDETESALKSATLSLLEAGKPEAEQAKQYVSWQNAGGPNECAHGYAAGIPCPDSDATVPTPEAPKCGVCGGRRVIPCNGEGCLTHDFCEIEVGIPCPTCHGTGSATGEAK